jgi:LppX_LprAFG lipoprotein
MHMGRWWALGMVVLFGAVLVAACTGTKPTEVPLPDPMSVLAKAAAEVRGAKTLKIKLQLTGAPSYVDPPQTPGGIGNNIAFVSANGAYVAPDRIQAKVVARIYGFPGEVEVIAIGDDQWMRNKILTADKWLKQTFSPGFNAQTLVSSDQGIEAALKALKDVQMVGIETIYNVPMYHVKGNASGVDISALTVGLIRGNQVVADIYIVVETGRVDHAVLVQPDTVTDKDPKPSTWLLEIFDYNTDIQITSPDVIGTAEATEAAATQAEPPAATVGATQSP